MLLKQTKAIIGLGNQIGKKVVIYPGAYIGNNNKIFDGSIIYPGTVIGNNNVILDNNILGEHPIDSNETHFEDKKFGGLIIGDNNFFHINNKVYSGLTGQTKIGNYNKILAESHIGHDCLLENYVNIYTRTLLCGYVTMSDFSGTGVGTFIHQRRRVGAFGFTAMNSSIVRDSFPFFINIDNKKYSKINYHRIQLVPDYAQLVKEHETILYEMCNHHVKKTLNLEEYKDKIPLTLFHVFKKFIE
jgi:UDP-N-acetylglucosamine acyltransferase